MVMKGRQVKMPHYALTKKGGVLLTNFGAQTGITGRTAESKYVSLYKSGYMKFHKGFSWDFGTGAIDTPAVILASLVHDGLTNLIAFSKLPQACRQQVDKEYKRYLKIGGMSCPRRQWQYHGIRLYVRLLKPIFG